MSPDGSVVRTLTAADELALARFGYERGEVLLPDTGSPRAHRYRLDARSSLIADGLVLLERTGDRPSYRFLDTNGLALTVRELRRFRIVVKVADASPEPPSETAAAGPADPAAPTDLVDLREDALDNGLLDGVDFAVVGASPTVGDECIVLAPQDGSFVVGYREGGTTTTMYASRSMAQARAVFLDEACWLGADRGRGTYVGRSQAVGTEDWTPAQVVAAYERRLLGDL